jgi:basic amino acid/polyamine antiporter, APA family
LLIKLLPLVTVMVLIAFKANTTTVAVYPQNGLNLSAVNASAILCLWALLGFESASIAADKVKDAARIVPRATLIGTLATGIFYLIVCSGIVLMLPVATLAQSEAPFGLFVETYWGHGLALTVSAFAAISAIGALSGWTLMQAELPASMARSGLLPAVLAQQNQRAVPVVALIISGAICSLFVLANSSKSITALFEYMAKLSTSATLWLYLGIAAAALKLGTARIPAALGLAFALWTLWGAGIEVSAMSWLLMLAGLPIYYAVRRSRRPIQDRSANIS